jgi:DNA-binding beta-propeller fold protein YncE
VVTALAPAVRATLPPPPPAADGGYSYLAIAVSPDGSRLLTVDDDKRVAEWDLRSGKARALPRMAAESVLRRGSEFDVAVSPDLATLAAAGPAEVETEASASGDILGHFKVTKTALEQPVPFVLSPDGTLIAIADEDGSVSVLDLATQRSRALEPPDSISVASLAFSPDGKVLAMGDGDGGTVYLMDVASGQLIATLPAPSQDSAGVTALAFGEKGALLAAGDDDSNVYLWDIARQRVSGALSGSPARADMTTVQVVFSPDGGLVACSFTDDLGEGSIRVWSAATGRRLALLNGQDPYFGNPFTFGLGGTLLASVTLDGGITEWSLGRS